MIVPQFRVLEQFDTFTPLGLRFWDPAIDRQITDGLRVTAWPPQAPTQQTAAMRTRSGVYAFRWLPGVRPIEHRYADPDFFDASLPQRRAFVITVIDELERFLPAAFRVDLPLPYPGIFLAESAASIPDGSPRGVYLFSAPTRRTDDRLTAVRGTLLDAETRTPLPWARVSVGVPHGGSAHGLSDADGRFAVLLPLPSLEAGFAGSPGSFGHGTPIGDRGWDITLGVNSQPGVLTSLPGTTLPEYRSIFDQLDAALWSAVPDPSNTSEPQRALRLLFGQQLIVRTQSLSEQLVTPAPSSP
jgi:hypothetical protein